MALNIIVAHSENMIIGIDNDLPFNIPGDLQRFKKITEGHIVVMGRNTWESLPIKPLPNRLNLVVSSKPIELNGIEFHLDKGFLEVDESSTRLGVTNNLGEVLGYLNYHKNEVFIIGGEAIYTYILDNYLEKLDTIYATLYHSFIPVDRNTNYKQFPILRYKKYIYQHFTTIEDEDYPTHSFLTITRKK